MPIPDAKTTVIENSLTLVTEEIASLRSVAMGVLVGTGSGSESEKESGISHFIEHMLFKGTTKRSAYDIAHALDAVGGKINAYTGKEFTMYYAVVLDKHIDVAIDVLSDIVVNSLYDDDAIELEKGVVLEEIKMYEDTPDELIHDYFAEKILHGHTLAKPIIGNEESVRAISRGEILNYLDRSYGPQNTVIALAGAVPKDIVSRISKAFAGYKGIGVRGQYEIPQIKGGQYLKKKKTEQVHLCLGTKGVSQIEDDRYPYAVLDNILGGSMSSHLFQEVREKRGLVYSIYSTSSPFRDFGLSYVYAGTSAGSLEQVINLILLEFSQLKKEGISLAELDKARENLKGSLVLGLESTSSRMSWLAKSQMYHNRVQTIDEVFEKVDKVTNDDIIRMANDYFKDEYLTLAVIGDLGELPPLLPWT
ncbi:MAG: pitrilysin family protein [Candidatus Margulisbacteria bacterium]|nr:pitrilysin family protein [Candidatus Margulisiibacteriota bacterium]